MSGLTWELKNVNIRIQPRPTESEILEWAQDSCVLTSSPSDSDVWWGTTGLKQFPGKRNEIAFYQQNVGSGLKEEKKARMGLDTEYFFSFFKIFFLCGPILTPY